VQKASEKKKVIAGAVQGFTFDIWDDIWTVWLFLFLSRKEGK